MLIAACSDPRDQALPKDVSDWKSELKSGVDKLTPAEREAMTAYVKRHKATPSVPVAPGTTVRQALAEQSEFAAAEARKAAEAKALQDKIAQERQAWRKRFDDAVTVSYVGKKLDDAGLSGEFLAVTLTLKNTGAKDIATFKGRVEFFDASGAEITHEVFEYKKGLAAGTTATETVRMYRLFDPVYKNPAIGNDKMRFHYKPEQIVFADGAKLVMPKEPD